MPPRIATANALMPNSVPMSECTLNSGAIRRPARPASTVESANDAAIARRTLMPIRRAASGILHHGEQRLAVARAVEQQVQRERDAEADQRNDELQRIDAGAEDLDRLLREHRREAARLLAEGEQHDVVEHDAARDRRHQPGIGAALGERPHQRALDQQPEQRAQQRATIATASGQRPAERDARRCSRARRPSIIAEPCEKLTVFETT